MGQRVSVCMCVLVHTSRTLKAIMVLSQQVGINYHMPTSSNPSVWGFPPTIQDKRSDESTSMQIHLIKLSNYRD